MLQKTSKNEQGVFRCEKCDYSTSRLSNWERHLKTKRHNATKMLHEKRAQILPTSMEEFVCECGRSYRQHSSYYRHKRSCKVDVSAKAEPLSEAQMALVSKMVESACRETVKVVEKYHGVDGGSASANHCVGSVSGSNNTVVAGNQYNIQLFLDEKCKDALTIQRFIDQLRPALEAMENGKVCGVTTTLLKGLEPLKITERPIHYADVQGTWHVNDEASGWEAGDGADVVAKTEEAIARQWPTEFKGAHPEWEQNEKLGDSYVKISSNVSSDLTNRDISGVLQEVKSKVNLNGRTMKDA